MIFSADLIASGGRRFSDKPMSHEQENGAEHRHDEPGGSAFSVKAQRAPEKRRNERSNSVSSPRRRICKRHALQNLAKNLLPLRDPGFGSGQRERPQAGRPHHGIELNDLLRVLRIRGPRRQTSQHSRLAADGDRFGICNLQVGIALLERLPQGLRCCLEFLGARRGSVVVDHGSSDQFNAALLVLGHASLGHDVQTSTSLRLAGLPVSRMGDREVFRAEVRKSLRQPLSRL